MLNYLVISQHFVIITDDKIIGANGLLQEVSK